MNAGLQTLSFEVVYSILKIGRMEWLSVYRKSENVRAGIVATDIERPASPPRRLPVDVGVENAFLLMVWSGSNRSHGLDHDCIAVVDPLLRLEELIAFGKVVGYIAALHGGCRADHP